MNRKQQRHRRRQEARNKYCKALGPAAVLALLCCLPLLPTTGAYFTDRAETEASFRATTFADNLALIPGSSKTNDSPGDPGPAFHVAQTVSDQITLDFGTYPAGNKRNFPSVLVVNNTGNRLLILNWRFCDNLAPFFEQQEGLISIAPGEEYTLGFKLDTHPGDQPGEYIGTLLITALDGFITAELPARLRLAAKRGRGGQAVQDQKESNHDKDDGQDCGQEQKTDQDIEDQGTDPVADSSDANPEQPTIQTDEQNKQANQDPDGTIETGGPPQETGEAVSPGESGDDAYGAGDGIVEQSAGTGGSSDSGSGSGGIVEQGPGH